MSIVHGYHLLALWHGFRKRSSGCRGSANGFSWRLCGRTPRRRHACHWSGSATSATDSSTGETGDQPLTDELLRCSGWSRWCEGQVGGGEAAVCQVGADWILRNSRRSSRSRSSGVPKTVLAIAPRTSDQTVSTGLRAGVYGGSRTVVSQSCSASYRSSPAAGWVWRQSQTTTTGPLSWIWPSPAGRDSPARRSSCGRP